MVRWRSVGRSLRNLAWAACVGLVCWLWFAPARSPALSPTSTRVPSRAAEAPPGAKEPSSAALPPPASLSASHHADAIQTWIVEGAGGLRGGLVLNDLFVLNAPSAVFLVPLDRSRPPVRLSALSAAIGRPAAVAPPSVRDAADTVWVYSEDSAQLVLIRPDYPEFRTLKTIRGAHDVRQVRWLRSGEIVANGFFSSETLRLMRVKDDALDQVASIGTSLFPGVDPEIAFNLNRNRMAVRPDETAVVQAFLYVPKIQAFDLSGRLLLTLSAPEEVTLKYAAVFDPNVGRKHFVRTDETRSCYIDVATDGSRIYALFSGKSTMSDPANPFGADVMDVFSWNGTFEGRWRLPYTAVGVVSDARAGRLFILTRGSEPKVVEISLGRARRPVRDAG